MKRWSWLLALIPLGLGLLAAIYLWFIAKTNPIAFLRIDLGSLAFVLGLGLSVLVGAIFYIRLAWEQRRQAVLAQAADERRRFLRRLDHELKNPLTAIRAGLANLAGSPSEGCPPGSLGQRRSPGLAPQPPVSRPAETG